MKNIFIKLLLAIVAVVTGFSAIAGTLDGAPFKISLPGNDWKLSDSTSQDMGHDVYLVASLTKTNSSLKSLVVKTVSDGSFTMSLDELAAGMRNTLNNPIVTGLSEEETIFLGFKAKHFMYQIVQNGQIIYNEAIVFVISNTGWTIAALGPVSQKDEVKKVFTYYQKNDHK